MARALLIANPIAARTDELTRKRVEDVFGGAGWRLDIGVTGKPEDARHLAREAVTAGMDVVAVFGGDGTTMQAAAELVGTETALGLIPGGTGNVLAGNLGVPSNPVRATRALLEGRRRVIDLGRANLENGAHYFGVACGTGVDAHVMARTLAADKRRWGIGAYLATTLRVLSDLRSTPCVITVDGERFEMPAALVMVMNCGRIPPPLMIRPDIRPDDGVLDLVAVAADSAWQGIRGLMRVVVDGRRSVPRNTPYVRYARGARFEIEPAVPLPVQCDGDAVGSGPFTVQVVPKAITVMVGGD